MATEGMETRHRGAYPTQKDSNDPEAPSGFILKLYQMVNGAPNEVIAWTKEGDAFIIGSDIKRLETETLPQFFRHNRFQSLVRQLNFYSFRKINRERNVWIYKHELFHRDRPENLFLVRRRTCPGLDGRKQRTARFPIRGPGDQDYEDDSSSIDSRPEESSPQVPSRKKRTLEDADLSVALMPAASKRQSIPASSDSPPGTPLVDTSILQASNEISETEDADDQTSMSKVDPGSMAEQSLIVSEVAQKLEEYARKAMRGRSGARSRRSGIVTPPTVPASSLFTYDDEYSVHNLEESFASSQCASPPSGPKFCGATNPPEAPLKVVTPDSGVSMMPPIIDSKMALAITNDMVLSSPEHLRSGLIAPTAVACFCMSTSPYGDKELSTKILHLIASCEKLAYEFQLYRLALHPVCDCSGISLYSNAVAVQQIWLREASRGDAVRDFKTFAINCIDKLLASESLEECNQKVLERTADLWRESIGVGSY